MGGVDRVVRDVGPRVHQGVEAAGVEHPGADQVGHPVHDGRDDRRVRVRLHEHAFGAGVGEDPRDLLRRRGLVDRHRDRAREPDGVVRQSPLQPGAAHETDAVAGCDAAGDEALGQRGRVGEELRCAHVDPPVALRPGEHGRVGRAAGSVHDDVGHGPGVGLHGGWDGELAHVGSSSSRH